MTADQLHLLAELQTVLELDSDRFHMSEWFETQGGGGSALKHGCGTTACLAGWACLLKGYQPIGPVAVTKMGQIYNVQSKAAELLGLDAGEAETVFFICGWPDDLRRAYERARTREDQAQVAAERIRRLREAHLPSHLTPVP